MQASCWLQYVWPCNLLFRVDGPFLGGNPWTSHPPTLHSMISMIEINLSTGSTISTQHLLICLSIFNIGPVISPAGASGQCFLRRKMVLGTFRLEKHNYFFWHLCRSRSHRLWIVRWPVKLCRERERGREKSKKDEESPYLHDGNDSTPRLV